MRGNSSQIYEKYQQLARDAASSGDRIAAENFYQHAEHYYRLLEASGGGRTNGAQDDAQQRGEGRNPNDFSAQSGDAEQSSENGDGAEAVVVVEVDAQPVEEQRTEHAPESVAALIEAVEQQAGSDAEEAPAVANGSGEGEAKPARRSRSRRPNGSANGRGAAKKEAEASAGDEDAEAASEDSNPANA